MIEAHLNLAFAAAFVLLMVTAVISDVTRLTIPNWISCSLAALYAIFAAIGGEWASVPWHVLVAIGVLIVGFALFSLGWMGAGDVKLMSAAALWAGPGQVVWFILYMGLTGAALAAVVAGGTFYLYWDGSGRAPNWVSRLIPYWVRKGLIPYGFAIGVGALLTVPAVIL